MRAILIDPADQSLAAWETNGTLSDIYRILGCETVDAVSLPLGDVVYVDDDGLLADEPGPFFSLVHYPHPLAGRGLVLGVDDLGDHCHCRTTIPQLFGLVDFPDVEFVGLVPFSGKQMIGGRQFAVTGQRPIFKPRGKK